MRIEFRVEGLPPKKDGANSMWSKPGEAKKLRLLRLAAIQALAGHPPLQKNIRLTLRAHIASENTRNTGDLDNFLTGICDGLQAADPRARPAIRFEDVIHPTRVIAIEDDTEVIEILASKVIGSVETQFYEVVLEGELSS
jgi:hypothetical protein